MDFNLQIYYGLIKKCYNQNQQNKLHIYQSKMFSLCKTIKIYQTVNHYHTNAHDHHHSIDSHEIKYTQTKHPSTIDSQSPATIQITDTHSTNRKKLGISLSIKHSQQHNSLQNKKIQLSISKKDYLKVSKSNINQLSSIKMKSTQRFQYEEPKIIQSKITYDSPSPKVKIYQNLSQDKRSIKDHQTNSLSEVPLKRQITKTTQYSNLRQSVDNIQPWRIQVSNPLKRQIDRKNYLKQQIKNIKPLINQQSNHIQMTVTKTTHESRARQSIENHQHIFKQQPNPLKRSTNFLRSSIRNKIGDNIKNSVDLSIKNNPQSKMNSLNASKIIKKQQNSQSLLRLSCSSYSRIFQRSNNTLFNGDSLSQTYSLELKKQQSFLKEYGNDVSRSIILGKVIPQKQMKNARSNFDLLSHQNQFQQRLYNPTKSDILQRECQSPTLKKLRNFYGDNLLNFYDQDTIISKSFVSRSNESKEKKHIIDESIILQHIIEDKFTPIINKVQQSEHYKIFLARQQQSQLLISIKEIPIDSIDKINQEISLYKELQVNHIDVGILQLHQVYTHGNIYILVKQPYQYTCKQFIQKHLNKTNEREVYLFIKSVQETLRKIIKALQAKEIYLCKFITIQDLVFTLGDWKCHSPSMFTTNEGQQTSIPLQQAIQYLKDGIINGLRRNHLCK